MPFLFEHFFSTSSILSSSLVLSSDCEGQGTRNQQRDEPLKRIQNVPQTSWQIFFTEVILFTQVDNDLRDSRKFVNHYFALFFTLLYFLEAHSSEHCQRKYMEHVHPAW
jgi:hypothetical protein